MIEALKKMAGRGTEESVKCLLDSNERMVTPYGTRRQFRDEEDYWVEEEGGWPPGHPYGSPRND